MYILFLIFVGGGLGSMARYGMMQLINKANPGSNFPWHTLGVNIIGAFVVGLLMEALALRTSIPTQARYFLITGVIGGFTTFSAFSLDTALLLERGDYLNSGLYIVASVVGTVAALFFAASMVKAIS